MKAPQVSIAQRIAAALLALGVAVAWPATAEEADAALVERYSRTCAVCHAAGAAGAPKTGVASEWENRMAKGMDTLVNSVKNGMNAMPPKGMCFDCSEQDYRALIEYMSTPR